MDEGQNQQPNIEELKRQLTECEKLRDEYLAGWQRQKADFLNFKKEQAKLLELFEGLAKERFVLELLPAIDNLQLSMLHLPQNLEDNDWVGGLKQSIAQLYSWLKAFGIEEIKALGEKFNPELHETAGETENTGQESGTIVEEIQKGYTISGKVIRPAKVKIAK